MNSYNVWNYAEGQDFYYASMLVDLTLPPDEVASDFMSVPDEWVYECNINQFNAKQDNAT